MAPDAANPDLLDEVGRVSFQVASHQGGGLRSSTRLIRRPGSPRVMAVTLGLETVHEPYQDSVYSGDRMSSTRRLDYHAVFEHHPLSH